MPPSHVLRNDPDANNQLSPSHIHSHTLRRPQWTYFHLCVLRTDGNSPSLDIITTRQNINSALSRFLGFMGTTIDVDILKLEGEEVWVRVPRDMAKAFHEAMSGWTSAGGQTKYVIKGRDDWLVKLATGSGQDLF